MQQNATEIQNEATANCSNHNIIVVPSENSESDKHYTNEEDTQNITNPNTSDNCNEIDIAACYNESGDETAAN